MAASWTRTRSGRQNGRENAANTRYLVLGDFPDAATQATLEKAWEAMNKEAVGLGIETITINEFLAQMGHKPQDRTVPLGEGATAADFPATTVPPKAPCLYSVHALRAHAAPAPAASNPKGASESTEQSTK